MGGGIHLWSRAMGHYLNEGYMAVRHLIRISLFQPCCACCENLLLFKREKRICHACRDQVAYYDLPVCRKCGKAIGDDLVLCGDCLIDPPPFRKHRSYARYDGVLKEMILCYKFKGNDGLKNNLAGYLVELYRRQDERGIDWIIPVPEDRGRKRKAGPVRGITKKMSRKLKIPMMDNNLVKVKKTVPQVGLSQARRLRNLDGAFDIKNPRILKNRKILLVDDVYTTGTTMKKCARPLKKAGAEVVGMTLARSV